MKTRNQILQGASGSVGDLVVYQLYGQTVVRRKPVRSAPPTEAQLDNQLRQKEAIIYGKQMKDDPAYVTASEANRKRYPTSFTAAVADYRRQPALVGALIVPGQADMIQFMIDSITVQGVTIHIAEYDASVLGGVGLTPISEHGQDVAVYDT